MAETEVLHLSDLSFGDLVLASEGFILVDFYLASTPDCQREGVVIEDLAPKYQGKVILAKLDVDKNPGIASRYKVISVPTLILFKDGEEIDRMVGFVSEEELTSYLNKHLGLVDIEPKKTKKAEKEKE